MDKRTSLSHFNSNPKIEDITVGEEASCFSDVDVSPQLIQYCCRGKWFHFSCMGVSFQEWSHQREIDEESADQDALFKCKACKGEEGEEMIIKTSNGTLEAILNLIKRELESNSTKMTRNIEASSFPLKEELKHNIDLSGKQLKEELKANMEINAQ